MKHLASILILFFVGGFDGTLAQNPLVKQWDYRFGGSDADPIRSIHQTSDGGYILGGYSLSDISGDKTTANRGGWDYWIVKIDSLCNKQWDKDFGGINDDQLFSLQKTTDGGYILGGYSYSDSSGDKTQANWDTTLGSSDFWIVKVDSLGNKQWDKDFGGTNFDELYSVQQTTDGGYILGGWSASPKSGDKTKGIKGGYDYWIIKIDSIGNMEWDKDFGGIGLDYLLSLQQTTDGGYILGGYSRSGSSGDKTQANWDTTLGSNDFWIIKVDSLGNKQWDKDIGGTKQDLLYSLQQTTDGGYILGGDSRSDSSGDKTQHLWGNGMYGDYWIVKIDSLGNKQWDKDFGGSGYEEFLSLLQASDGGYLLLGYSSSPISGDKTEKNLGFTQPWIVKTDSLGNKQWDKTIFTNGLGSASSAIQINDGCYIIANITGADTGGYKTQHTWGSTDYWIIKFCDTTSTTGINKYSINNNQFSLFPNPTTGTFTLQFANPLNTTAQFTLTDVLGRTVYVQSISETSTLVTLPHPSGGMYFYKVTDKERILGAGKVVVE